MDPRDPLRVQVGRRFSQRLNTIFDAVGRENGVASVGIQSEFSQFAKDAGRVSLFIPVNLSTWRVWCFSVNLSNLQCYGVRGNCMIPDGQNGYRMRGSD